MQPTITRKPAIQLVGMSFYGDPFDTRAGWDEGNHIGKTWTRLMRFLEENPGAIQHLSQLDTQYEVHIYHPDTLTQGLFEVFVGLEVAHLESVPVVLQVKILPPTEYAVFTLQGQAITGDWGLEIDAWIETAGYRRTYPYSFQLYDSRFKSLDNIEESSLDVYMPVEPAE
jgi:predicted transcriptional regulator YdeE